MTRCTSSINDCTLNCIAFRASTCLYPQKLMMPHAAELVPRHSEKDAQGHQSMRNDAKQSHLAASSAEPDWRFPQSALPNPTDSSWSCFPTRPTVAPRGKATPRPASKNFKLCGLWTSTYKTAALFHGCPKKPAVLGFLKHMVLTKIPRFRYDANIAWMSSDTDLTGNGMRRVIAARGYCGH